ncbi:major facilitator superfamily domain-containing protein [Irpex rosettiformis]|uniref:Major facilitator superfamily domain-containing protein n=1 Tax=Irpex rosettiformis TaxID=378272 RepID=A0ACB8UH26_9APHY|nr:major facilitator superfamily domain-containing protein [Irpex rosettiformis]
MVDQTTHGEASTAHDTFAVDIVNDYVPPLKDPHLLAVATGETVVRRRASDFNRSRPLNLTKDIELTPIDTSTKVDSTAGNESLVQVSKQGVTVDIERASSTGIFPSTTVSQAPSTREHGSTTNLTGSRTATQRRWARMHFAVLCYNFFLAGWNDGSTGPLLPTIQRAHHIGFAIVSMLFIINSVGYVLGAVANVHLDEKLGIGKTLLLGSITQLMCYVLLATGGPFPLMCVAFFFGGFGFCLQITQGNTFVGTLENASPKLGLLHASYGLGALSAPLVATQFSSQQHWYFHYLISTGLAIINVALISSIFRLKTSAVIKAEGGLPPAEDHSDRMENRYKQILTIPSVHFMAFWTLVYVGVEVTLGGWIVTFIQEKRGGGTSAGYISSGFFGGLMMGRLTLLWLNQKIGEHRVMFLYAVLAIGLEATIWAVPSAFENAIAVSFIGLLMGPMYPILVHHSAEILPKWLYPGCIGWISGLGQTGSAVLPFLTGLLASRFGISSLQPFVVSMMSTMIVLWAFVPRVRKVD